LATLAGGVLGASFLLIGFVAPALVLAAALLAWRYIGPTAALMVLVSAIAAVLGLVAIAYLGGWRPGPGSISG
jgi:hypothetical protein